MTRRVWLKRCGLRVRWAGSLAGGQWGPRGRGQRGRWDAGGSGGRGAVSGHHVISGIARLSRHDPCHRGHPSGGGAAARPPRGLRPSRSPPNTPGEFGTPPWDPRQGWGPSIDPRTPYGAGEPL